MAIGIPTFFILGSTVESTKSEPAHTTSLSDRIAKSILINWTKIIFSSEADTDSVIDPSDWPVLVAEPVSVAKSLVPVASAVLFASAD